MLVNHFETTLSIMGRLNKGVGTPNTENGEVEGDKCSLKNLGSNHFLAQPAASTVVCFTWTYSLVCVFVPQDMTIRAFSTSRAFFSSKTVELCVG